MATFLRTKVANNIGTTPITVLNPIGTSKYTIIGCSLANTTDYDVIIDVTILDASLNEGYYVKHLIITPYTSAKIVTNGEKLVLAENCKMNIVSDTDDSIDAIISYAEIV